MKVCFLTTGNISSAEEGKLSQMQGADLVIFGFNGLGLVSYKKELSGETEYFQDLAKLSKQLSSVIVCGTDTDTYGVYRHSAVVADNGRILGVTDMMHAVEGSEYVASGAIKVYETSKGKIGVLINQDLFSPKIIEILSMCDADIIVCIFNKIEDQIPQIVLRSSAFIFGLPMCLVAKSYAIVSDEGGKVIISGASDIVKADVKIEKKYYIISNRKRGLSKS